MMLILILSVGGLLIMLGLLHFYWVLGGQWGIQGAMPEKFKESFFDPKNQFKMKFSTLVVGVGLILFAVIIFSNQYPVSSWIESWMTRVGTLIIAVIFTLRAIGDLNIVGIFKKPSDSVFARNDNKIYIPICLFLAVGSYLVYFFA